MDFNFKSQYFGVTENAVHFLRGGLAYRTIKAEELKKVELTKGTDVKHTLPSFLFGGILLFISIWFIANFSGFNSSDALGEIKSVKALGYSIAMILFLIGLGSYSIYRALPIHPVVKFSMMNGDIEVMSIQKTIQDNKVDILITSLIQIIGTSKINFDRQMLERRLY